MSKHAARPLFERHEIEWTPAKVAHLWDFGRKPGSAGGRRSGPDRR